MNPSEARGDNTWVSAAGTWGGEFHPEFGPKKYLLEREQVEERTAVVEGFNRRPHVSMSDFKIWSDVEPPKGTMYNYPVRPWQNSRPNLAAYPAPPEIAVQIFKRVDPDGVDETAQWPVDPAGDRLGQGRSSRLHALTWVRRRQVVT